MNEPNPILRISEARAARVRIQARRAARKQSPITNNQKFMFRLIERSPDIGEGWRQSSTDLWSHVVDLSHPDLTELDYEHKRVRFTPKGLVVMQYLL